MIHLRPLILTTAVIALGLSLQGCIVAGAAVGATKTVVHTGTRVVVATGRAITPGESREQRDKREYKAWKKARRAEGH